MTTYNPEADYGTSDAGSLIPKGMHAAAIREVELTTTRNGDPMIVCTFEAIAGPAQGARLRFQNYVLTDKAFWKYGQLAGAAVAKGHDPKVPGEAAGQLLAKPMIIKVGVKPARDGYDESVEVKSTRALTTAEINKLKAKHGPSMLPPDFKIEQPVPGDDADGGYASDDDDDDDDIPF